MLIAIAQLLGLAMFIAGLYLIVGLAWSLLIVGLLVVSVFTFAEVNKNQIKARAEQIRGNA